LRKKGQCKKKEGAKRRGRGNGGKDKKKTAWPKKKRGKEDDFKPEKSKACLNRNFFRKVGEKNHSKKNITPDKKKTLCERGVRSGEERQGWGKGSPRSRRK